VARMPRPALTHGRVLVRARYSLISAGTELAALMPADQGATTSTIDLRNPSAALELLGKALRDPRKATKRVGALVRVRAAKLLPPPTPVSPVSVKVGGLTWTSSGAAVLETRPDGSLHLDRDTAPNGYQALSQRVDVPAGHAVAIRIRGNVEKVPVLVGVLNEDGSKWVGTAAVGPGPVDDVLVFSGGEPAVTVVLANTEQEPGGPVALTELELEMIPPSADGGPASDLDHQGWNVGYSLAGEVVAVAPDVTDLRPGDVVACAGAGYANHAELVSVPRNLVCKVPAGCSIKAAATATVGAIALQGVRRAAPQLGDRTCVIGLGLIGQITAQLLAASGCTVLGFDLDAKRVERARANGLDRAISDRSELDRAILETTAGQGVDQTIITAGSKSNEIVNLAMEITRRKGKVVVVGDVGLGVERAVFYRKEIDLLISTSYGPGRYDRTYEEEGIDYPYGYVRWTLNRNMQAYLEQAATGHIDIESLIDRVYPVTDATSAYESLLAQGERPIGVLIEYGEETKADEPGSIAVRGAARARREQIRFALVGAGAFGTSMLLPKLKADGRFFLQAVVSRDAVRGGNLARTERAPVLASDLSEVIDSPDIDLLVIATRHREHAAQVVAGLDAGKNVFVEKPLALSWEELRQVAESHDRRSDGPVLMVGYNRRFSPALQALAGALNDRTSPLVVTYRVNAGYLPLDHWTQGPDGGGRNLGEACHMYDVFRFLVGGPVESITANAIDPTSGVYLSSDNFVATLTYEDGSVCNLVYTALGPKEGLPKERIEVFAGGQAYLLDDFHRLERCGDSTVLWSGETDKGHAEEIRLLGQALSAGDSDPISYDELLETSVVSLAVEDMIRGGNG